MIRASNQNAGIAPGKRAEELFTLVYEELRALAHSWFLTKSERGTLQPTALVHEAFLRLVKQTNNQWKDQTHFKATAAKAMRQILLDHARHRRALKRGGGRLQVQLDTVTGPESNIVDMVDLDAALKELSRLNARQALIVEMKFFGGLGVKDIATILKRSRRTIELEWNMARGWLLCRLEGVNCL